MENALNIFNPWQSGTAALMALAITTAAPLLTTTPASAQLFPRQSTQIAIPTGLPSQSDRGEKIVIAPKETMPLTLTVAANIVNRSGSVLIPAGSQVIGQLQPANGGSQFVARELAIYQSRRQPINATSRVITKPKFVGEPTRVLS